MKPLRMVLIYGREEEEEGVDKPARGTEMELGEFALQTDTLIPCVGPTTFDLREKQDWSSAKTKAGPEFMRAGLSRPCISLMASVCLGMLGFALLGE